MLPPPVVKDVVMVFGEHGVFCTHRYTNFWPYNNIKKYAISAEKAGDNTYANVAVRLRT